MAQKLGNGPQSRAPLKWGEGAKNLTANRHQGCLKNVPQDVQSKEETEENGEMTEKKPTRISQEKLKIGTWNVRSANRDEKLVAVKKEMQRYGINILGISETKMKGKEDEENDGMMIVKSGGEQRQRGVAIIFDQEAAKRITEVEKCSDRVIMVKVSATPVDMVIIQVYMPTTDHEDEEVEEIYEQIEKILDRLRSDLNVVVMGDFNAIVGEGSDEKVIGKYGLGKRNDRGQRMIEFCKKNNLVVTNTWFQQEKRRRYTWTKPGDTGRFQIDYILVRQRYRNGVKCSKSYPGADAFTDHNLVAMQMLVKLKKLKKKRRKQKWDVERLRRNNIPFQRSVEIAIKDNRGMSSNERWIKFKSVVLSSAQSHIGYERKSRIKKPWITAELMGKIEERRKWKNKRDEEGKKRYRQLNNETRREAVKAKELWWSKKCDELEELDAKGRTDLVYDKVAKLTWKKEMVSRNVSVADNAGNIITEPEEVREIFRKYAESLYDKDGKPKIEDLCVEEEEEIEEDEKGPSILRSEILSAISELKEGKAVGVDEIPAEMVKNLGEKALQEIVDICQSMYEEGKWPDDFTRTVMIPLPKKSNAVKCGDFRTISLICHASKIMLRVLTKRIETKAKQLLGRSQFGFRKGCGTRDAIGVMRTLCERSLEHKNNDVYICFVDFEKAFDRVDWVKMFKILEELHVDWKDRRLLQDLYMRQEAVVRIANGDSAPGTIGRGVRQGCPISPLLFSIYAEVMMIEVWEDIEERRLQELDDLQEGKIEAVEAIEEGILVGGRLVSDVRFADDQGMVASSEKGLQKLMNNLNDTAKKFNMKINVEKTKVMVVTQEDNGKVVDITIDGQRIEQVKCFKYLGSNITDDGRSTVDVKCRIAMAKEAFNKRKELLTKGLSKRLKKRMVKILIWPVVMYGCETWTLLEGEIQRLQAFEMWLWRRLEKIPWTDKVSNQEVLRRVEEKRCLMRTIWSRKKSWIGHVLRGEGLLREVLEGSMVGKRRPGRPRTRMLDDLMEKPRPERRGRGEENLPSSPSSSSESEEMEGERRVEEERYNLRGGRRRKKTKKSKNLYKRMKKRAENREAWKEWVPKTCLRAEYS